MGKYNDYFENMKTDYRHDYLVGSPRKSEVLANANIDGEVSILPNSNNRAIVIETPDKKYLQSYDTLILETDKATGETVKLWDGYSATTMKHINQYLPSVGIRTMGKAEWTKQEVGHAIKSA